MTSGQFRVVRNEAWWPTKTKSGSFCIIIRPAIADPRGTDAKPETFAEPVFYWRPSVYGRRRCRRLAENACLKRHQPLWDPSILFHRYPSHYRFSRRHEQPLIGKDQDDRSEPPRSSAVVRVTAWYPIRVLTLSKEIDANVRQFKTINSYG